MLWPVDSDVNMGIHQEQLASLAKLLLMEQRLTML